MKLVKDFLMAEIKDQGTYEEIYNFIVSYDIRCGEFLGDKYVVKKMDRINFLLLLESRDKENEREIHSASSLYNWQLINSIQEHAQVEGLKIIGELKMKPGSL